MGSSFRLKFFISFFLLTFLLYLGSVEPAQALSNGDCFNTTPVVVSGRITDPSGVVWGLVSVVVNDTTRPFSYDPGSGDWTATLDLSDDDYTLEVSAADACGDGNTGSTAPINFTVDLTPPTVSISSPTPGSTINSSTIVVKGTASDSGTGLASVEVVLDEVVSKPASLSEGIFTATFSAVLNGPHTLIATAGDNCGNYAESASVAVVVTGGCEGPVAMTGVVENVGGSGISPYYTSLALNKCDHPRIAYFRGSGGDLRYAAWNPATTTWDIQTVDGGGVAASLALDSNGNPHISYLDGTATVSYARWTGTAWDIQNLQSVGVILSSRTSLALDSNNYPHIAYLNTNTMRLRYAYWNGTGWVFQTVDSTGNSTGLYCSLALDSQGRPRISYAEEIPLNSGLNYAAWNGTGWDIERLVNSITPSSLEIDSQDNPGIAIGVEYFHWNGSEWDREVTEDTCGQIAMGYLYPSLELDNFDRPRIAHGWGYAFWNGIEWVARQEVEFGSMKSLALDSNGNPAISSYENVDNVLQYYHLPAGAPVINEINPVGWYEGKGVTISGYDFGEFQGTSTVTFTGTPATTVVSWSDTGIEVVIPYGAWVGKGPVVVTVAGKASLGYKFIVTPQWVSIVDSEGCVGLHTSLKLNADGFPRISYRDISNGDLKYAEWNGSTWEIQLVDDVDDVGRFSSLALDLAGNPRIMYNDFTNRDLKYAARDGTDWSIWVVDSVGDVGRYSRLALDDNDYPRCSYADFTNWALKYVAWNGFDWDFQVVDPGGGYNNSLVLDENDYPRISYRNNGLKYAAWTGTTWDFQNVDNTSSIVDNSLRLDNSGSPRISYCDGALNDITKYASWTGSNWDTGPVDNSDPVSGFNSLALDNSGNPSISYYGENGDLKYAVWNETAWDIRIIDSIGDAGRFCSLALNADGKARISYYDASYGDLRYYEEP